MASDFVRGENLRAVSDLPHVAVNPVELQEGDRPWDRYARADHDHPAYRLGDALVLRDLRSIKQVLSDRTFEQGVGRILAARPDLDPRFVERRKKSILLREGPDHLRMRRIASKSSFSPRAMERHRPTMRSIMERLADGVPADGVCDAVPVLTHEYPTRVISHVLGGSEDDIEMFSGLVETILYAMGGDPSVAGEAVEAHEKLDTYILELVEARRAQPGRDLISDLIQAETEDGTLTTEEVLSTAVSVITAGTDTTRNQLAIGLHLFAEHPDQWAALADEALLGAAVDEILRFSPLSHVLMRAAREDATVGDVRVPAETMVLLDVGGAHRDPRVCDDANVFDVTRTPPIDHLGLGFGHKFCLGASLATAELVEALRVLRRRFATIEFAGETEWRRVGFLQAPISLPLHLGGRA